MHMHMRLRVGRGAGSTGAGSTGGGSAAPHCNAETRELRRDGELGHLSLRASRQNKLEGRIMSPRSRPSLLAQCHALLTRKENGVLRAENANLRAENEQLREEVKQLRHALEEHAGAPRGSSPTLSSPTAVYRTLVPNEGGSFSSFVTDREATAAQINSVLNSALPNVKSVSSNRGGGSSSGGGSSGNGTRMSKEDIQKERRASLGELPILMRADTIAQGVLPLAQAFDKFDHDASGGISVAELRGALEYLGVEKGGEQAGALLKQYDKYPDQVLDVKEFATLVRDVRLMLAFDENGDGVLDASELQQALTSLGLGVELSQVERIIERFDVDDSGTIDLVELSSLVRTAQAFMRYDKDGSGAIDIDEMRDALRKLGIKAGALEESDLFRRYDADGSGEIELSEFATLVRDLQLYAAFDTNCDGSIDAAELHEALQQLGMRTTAEQSLAVFDATRTDGGSSSSAPAGEGGEPGLSMSEFTNVVADLRAFKTSDADRDGRLERSEVAKAFGLLGLPPLEPAALDAICARAKLGSTLDMVSFIQLVKSVASTESMRKLRITGSTQNLAFGAGSVLQQAEDKKRSRLLGNSDFAGEEVEPVEGESNSFNKTLTA